MTAGTEGEEYQRRHRAWAIKMGRTHLWHLLEDERDSLSAAGAEEPGLREALRNLCAAVEAYVISSEKPESRAFLNEMLNAGEATLASRPVEAKAEATCCCARITAPDCLMHGLGGTQPDSHSEAQAEAGEWICSGCGKNVTHEHFRWEPFTPGGRFEHLVDGMWCGPVVRPAPAASTEGLRWIPVSERIPGIEVDSEALAFSVENVHQLFDLAYVDEGQWFASWSGRALDSVTHWMPLPEPPDAALRGEGKP